MTRDTLRPLRMLALAKYGDLAASTRHRLLQYESRLAAAGIAIEVEPLLGNGYLRAIFAGRAPDLRRVAGAYARRLATLVRRRDFDLLWIGYEAFPYLPPIAESLCRLAGRPVIHDFDDATFHQYDGHRSALVRRLLGRKLEPGLRRAAACIAGSRYLGEYAGRFCPRTEVIPTVVDAERYRAAPPPDRPATVGWIGSPSTARHLAPALPLLDALHGETGTAARIVGAGPGMAAAPGRILRDWTEAGEVDEIRAMDIGIMPLPDEPWARGKCGLKLVQYMACGLPVVASPVGANRDIVRHGETGFLADGPDEWRAALEALIGDADLRRRMGAAGRVRVEAEFSLDAQAPRLAGLIRSVAP